MAENTEDEVVLNPDDTGPVEIDIEAGKVVDTKAEAEAAKPEDAPVIPADEGIESLKRQLAAEREQRAKIEAEARAAQERVKKADTDIVDARYQVIANAIDAVEREAEAAERDWQAAYERGDIAAAAKAQRTMAAAEAKLLQLQQGKQAIEAQKRAPANEAPDNVPTDPVERFAASLSPASGNWIRSHPECATNPRMNAKMIAAHHDAMAEGHSPDTPDYFAFIEGSLGFRKPATASAEPQRRESAPVAAPVARDAVHASGKPASPTRVRLTPAEKELCESNGWDLVDYAKNKMALIKEGKLSA